jgi:hypothetical protein
MMSVKFRYLVIFWHRADRTADVCIGDIACWEPAISLHSHHVSLVQWTNPLPPVTRNLGSNPLGGLMWNRDSPARIVSLHWWPWRDWSSLQPRLRRASSQTVTRNPCRQCDNPTWSHTAFLSRFHARCRSFFQLHNRRSRLLGGRPVECLQSHFILTMSHWSSGLTLCFPWQGTWVQIPWGDLFETGILLLVSSRYTPKFVSLFGRTPTTRAE